MGNSTGFDEPGEGIQRIINWITNLRRQLMNSAMHRFLELHQVEQVLSRMERMCERVNQGRPGNQTYSSHLACLNGRACCFAKHNVGRTEGG
jgi:hypothetical protein